MPQFAAVRQFDRRRITLPKMTKSEIAKWYERKVVFITGGTGFMGKVLVEKLLRSCPDIGTIYILIRPKKGVATNDRLAGMLESEIFDGVRATRKDLRNKLYAISGDVGEPDLGISGEDRRILQENVSIVFHVAATIKFNETLRMAIAVNVEGTRTLLHLSKGMSQLCAFIHVSTAFSNCPRAIIEERIYEPPVDPDKILRALEIFNDDVLDLVTPRMITPHPNTYTFTKAIAEHVVAEFGEYLPIVVVRPSIVTAALKEPYPGWIDSMAGLTGFVAATIKGICKCFPGRPEVKIDTIPVDISINLFIAAAWYIGTGRSFANAPATPVCNCVSGPFNPQTSKEFLTAVNSSFKKWKMEGGILPPRVYMINSELKYFLIDLFYHELPDAVADFGIWLRGGKPKFRRIRSQLNKTAKILRFFSYNQWDFHANNVKRLRKLLTADDREIFNFDASVISWNDYNANYVFGTDEYIMKKRYGNAKGGARSFFNPVLVKKIAHIVILIFIVSNIFNRNNIIFDIFLLLIFTWLWFL